MLAWVSWLPPSLRRGAIVSYTEKIRQFTQTGENSTRLTKNVVPDKIDSENVISMQNNFTAAVPNVPRTSLSADYLVKWHVYEMIITASTSAGEGTPIVVQCERGRAFPGPTCYLLGLKLSGVFRLSSSDW